MRPLVARYEPAAILTSVDLPAPFGPITAVMTPARIVSETSSIAVLAPNRLVTWSNTSIVTLR